MANSKKDSIDYFSKNTDEVVDDCIEYDDYTNEVDTVLKQSDAMDENVQSTLNASREYPKLTKEEEIELAKKAFDGDKSAKDKLILSNIGLVVHIAKRYRTLGVEFSDLFQEGNLALINAAEKFDPSKGYKFSTYAGKCIENAMITVIDKEKRASKNAISFERELEENGDSVLGRISGGNFGVTTEDVEDSVIQKENIKVLCNDLTPVERDIAKLLYGYEDGKKWSEKDIQKEFGFSPYRIRDIKNKIKNKVEMRRE